MPSYSYSPSLDPFQGVEYHDTSPDWKGAAASTAMLANMFSQKEQSNRAMALEQDRMQMENSRANNAATLDYMKQLRQDRLLESQQAMEMMKLGTEMREVNYRMDQAKKMDDAKWRARDARQQYFSLIPQMEQKLRDHDLIGADEDLALAYQIPGISDDEFSVKHMGEVSGLMSKFTIDGKPAVQVLRGIKNSLQTAGDNSTAWSDFKQVAQEFPTDLRKAATSIAAVRQELGNPAKVALYETYLRKMTNIMTPEKQAEMDSVLAEQRKARYQKLQEAADSGDRGLVDEIDANYDMLEERTKQTYMHGKYSPFYSSTNPTETNEYLSTVTKNITAQVQAATSYLDQLNGNLKIRAAFGRAKMNINDPEVSRTVKEKGTPEQKKAYDMMRMNPQVWNAVSGTMEDPAVDAINKLPQATLMDKARGVAADSYERQVGVAAVMTGGLVGPTSSFIPSKETVRGVPGGLQMLDEALTHEGNAIRKYQAELDFHHSTLLGQLARIAANPDSVTVADWKALNDAREAYGKHAAPFNGGVNPVSGNFFNRQFVDQIQRTIKKNQMRSPLGGPAPTSSLTQAPASGTPYPITPKK